jgi:lysozyme family protein
MSVNDDLIMAPGIANEGGWSDHRADAGGCTKHGVTLPTLQAYRDGAPTSCADVRALTADEAKAVYRKLWVDHPRMRLGQWPYLRAAQITFDASIMFSLGRRLAVSWMQEAINAQRPTSGQIEVDGWAGPATLAAMAMCNERELVAYVVGCRCMKHARVVKARPDQAVFIEGWIKRAVKWSMGR